MISYVLYWPKKTIAILYKWTKQQFKISHRLLFSICMFFRVLILFGRLSVLNESIDVVSLVSNVCNIVISHNYINAPTFFF